MRTEDSFKEKKTYDKKANFSKILFDILILLLELFEHGKKEPWNPSHGSYGTVW